MGGGARRKICCRRRRVAIGRDRVKDPGVLGCLLGQTRLLKKETGAWRHPSTTSRGRPGLTIRDTVRSGGDGATGRKWTMPVSSYDSVEVSTPQWVFSCRARRAASLAG